MRIAPKVAGCHPRGLWLWDFFGLEKVENFKKLSKALVERTDAGISSRDMVSWV